VFKKYDWADQGVVHGLIQYVSAFLMWLSVAAGLAQQFQGKKALSGFYIDGHGLQTVLCTSGIVRDEKQLYTEPFCFQFGA